MTSKHQQAGLLFPARKLLFLLFLFAFFAVLAVSVGVWFTLNQSDEPHENHAASDASNSVEIWSPNGTVSTEQTGGSFLDELFSPSKNENNTQAMPSANTSPSQDLDTLMQDLDKQAKSERQAQEQEPTTEVSDNPAPVATQTTPAPAEPAPQTKTPQNNSQSPKGSLDELF